MPGLQAPQPANQETAPNPRSIASSANGRPVTGVGNDGTVTSNDGFQLCYQVLSTTAVKAPPQTVPLTEEHLKQVPEEHNYAINRWLSE
ncbi:hypothetical protein TWF225_000137 [Orbilia oligospora]|uniref:Uncharacterized protein n=1 Tax=Orbilia oligospora TaxID=2813651 RepID=A0A8H2E3W3_ORBOL|nr:hypothetical protein TWF225_000137 [Orbilia oligospora]KAF3233718.1 hypothetical protein TWF128_002909 [Orbilia oligospora]KAF3256202.1 hypothetical protein TWF217_006448 [Orbilia oligospora]KAF3297497.1 hypothetical protein TWF132_005928 [Orbilia oligospora]TGJ69996.1 hypothetical protein EYR41_005994 [Orbilia oligospora]